MLRFRLSTFVLTAGAAILVVYGIASIGEAIEAYTAAVGA